MSESSGAILAAAVSLGAGLLATPGIRAFAQRIRLVAAPSADRWHKRPTALLGGAAIAGATALGIGAWLALKSLITGPEPTPTLTLQILAVGVAATFMFAVGVVDDAIRLRPQLKFVLQLLASVVLVAGGATLGLTRWYLVNVVVTVFWFVALTNAFNLLDNMDGVAAGVGAIAAFFLGVTFAGQAAWGHAVAAWSLAGAALGFLRYNFNPASIFMGDGGSLFIGSLLAGLVATSPASVSGSLVAVVFVPLAIMAVPIADTTLVTVTRTLASRAISQGGRDHSAHRLVALGLGERQVALLLYAFAALGGAVGLILMRLDRPLGLVLGTVFLAGLSLLAAYLGRLQVRYPDSPAGWKPATVVAAELLYKRRLAEMLLDVALVAVAYYGAYRLRFEGGAPPGYMEVYRSTLGLVIALKISAFGLLGVYRGAWRYAGLTDVYRILGAIGLSEAGLFAYMRWRVPLLATSNILYIDALLTATLVLAARMSFRSLEMIRGHLRRDGKPVAIYGAGDGGELAVRELLNNSALGLRPFCFLDDDPRKRGERIHGLPVLGGLDDLATLAERHGVHRILIATKKLSTEVLRAVEAFASAHELELLELDIQVRQLGGGAGERDVSAAIVRETGGVRPVARVAGGGG